MRHAHLKSTVIWVPSYLENLALTVLVSSAMLTEGIKYMFDLHRDYTKTLDIAEISYAAGLCSVLGTAWSKTLLETTFLRELNNDWVVVDRWREMLTLKATEVVEESWVVHMPLECLEKLCQTISVNRGQPNNTKL